MMTFPTLKLAIECLAFIFTALSAVLYLRSAFLPLTPISTGMEELDKVAALSRDLQRIGRWNIASAATLSVGVMFQAIGIMIDVWSG